MKAAKEIAPSNMLIRLWSLMRLYSSKQAFPSATASDCCVWIRSSLPTKKDKGTGAENPE